ncbi:MAG: glycoside hydrolase family 9 protein [Eubacteriales bacterium]
MSKKRIAWLVGGIIIIVGIIIAIIVSRQNDKDPSSDTYQTEAGEEETIVFDEDTEDDGETISRPPNDAVLNGEINGTEGWEVLVTSADAMLTEENGELKCEIFDVGLKEWHVQGFQDDIKLLEGRRYEFSLDMRSTAPREVELRIQENGGEYTGYFEESNLPITTEMETYTFEFVMDYESDPYARLAFNIGNIGDSKSIGEHTIYIDNVKIVNLDGDQDSEIEKNTDVDAKKIQVNQIGYRPDDEKIAIINGEGGTFNVVDNETGDTVFTGEATDSINDAMSGNEVYYADFTEFTDEGEYYISVPDFEDSYSFEIKNDVYNDLNDGLLKMFYYQRCGTELTEEYAGDWGHPEAHTEKATIHGTNNTKEVTGGWHDAGDYGRYTVPAAKAVADLLLTYDFMEDKVNNDFDIPESGNNVPDILDEVRYELEWMLKMQDDSSGGVYHKVTTAAFVGDDVMPEDGDQELILSPISGTATGDFAAVMAMAYRIYQPIDSEFAKQCLEASEKAWEWLEANKNAPGFTNPSGISTGEYGDAEDGDERYWAAAELYRATMDDKYHDYFKDESSKEWQGLGWADVGDYANIAYLSMDNEDVDSSIYNDIKETFLDKAEEYKALSNDDGYRISLDLYPWGSNMTVMNNAMHLIIANELENNKDYKQSAYNHIHYLLGRNPLAISYVTGFGENAAENPHHRPSIAMGETLPGMVVGGPNQNLEDPFALRELEGLPPAKCYVDETSSYSTNEITIYWNSPAVFVLSYYVE